MIVKGTTEYRYYRRQIAMHALSGLLAGTPHEDNGGEPFEHMPEYHATMAAEAVRFADALIDRLNQENDREHN